jgi:hypothetical protein
MYRRDYFLNETQRLAQVIAKMLGLKTAGDKPEEMRQVYNDALDSEYEIKEAELLAFGNNEFVQWLHQKQFSAAKINTLAQLLYYSAEPFGNDDLTLNKLQKTIALLDLLEQEYHMQLFENISKRQVIQQYLKQYGA